MKPYYEDNSVTIQSEPPPFYNPALRWMAAFYPAYAVPPVPPLTRSEEDDDA